MVIRSKDSKDCSHIKVGKVGAIASGIEGGGGQQWRCQLCNQLFIPFPNPVVARAIHFAVKKAVKCTVSYLGNGAILDPRRVPLDAPSAIVKITLEQLKK